MRLRLKQPFNMGQLTTEQRVFVITTYYETRSPHAIQEAFMQQFPDRQPPNKTTIWRNVFKYERKGTSLICNKGNSGRRRSVRTGENIELLRNTLEQHPHVTTRINPINISRSSFNRTTKIDLRWHPYRMKIRQQLQENDFQRRLQFCHWFEDRCRNPRFLPYYVISDESVFFFMNGKDNTQNIREYAHLGNPPTFNFDVNGSREKLTVWAAVCGNGSPIGPFFIDGNLNGNIYYEMLVERVFPALMENFEDQFEEDHFRRLWWAQDGASAHAVLQVGE